MRPAHCCRPSSMTSSAYSRSEEHTSELQSHSDLVCRLTTTPLLSLHDALPILAATILKGIFDYAGTYLVNFAGFGMITDLRDDLYNTILRRSAAFFQRHATGTLLSAIVNDIERIQ